MKYYLGLYICLVGWLVVLGSDSFADDFLWVGAGQSADWDDPGNWINLSGGSAEVPDSGDNACFQMDATTFEGDASSIKIAAQTTLTIDGDSIDVSTAIENAGEIRFGAPPNSRPLLFIDGKVELTGGGDISFMGNEPWIGGFENSILANRDNRICGFGSLVAETFVNDSMVRAEGGRLLLVNVENNGVFEIASDSTLSLLTLQGGVVSGEVGAKLEDGCFADATLEGHLTTFSTNVLFSGELTNNATLTFPDDPDLSFAQEIGVVGSVDLVGDGEILLVDEEESVIFGEDAPLLINHSNMIRGAGTIEVPMVNDSLIRAEAGLLTCLEPVDNFNGTIQIAADGNFLVQNCLTGGTIISEPGGGVAALFKDITLEGEHLTGFSNFSGTINNSGVFRFSSANMTGSTLVNDAFFQGGGEVIFGEQGDHRWRDTFGSSATLTNVDNVFRGSGEFDLSVNNRSLIRAEHGTLSFRAVDNELGRVELAEDAFLEVRTSFSGGILFGEPGSSFSGDNNSGLFTDVCFQGHHIITRVFGSETAFSGVINNQGCITFDSGTVELYVDENLTLAGGGELVLSNFSSKITGPSPYGGKVSQLLNIDHTIRGEGEIEVDFINQGTLLADSPGGTLVFDRDFLASTDSVMAVVLDGLDFQDSGGFRFQAFANVTIGGELKIIVGENLEADVGDQYFFLKAIGAQGAFDSIDQSASRSATHGYEFETLYGSVIVTDKYLLGDANLDGELNLLDVAPFIERLLGDEFHRELDFDGDNVVTLLDVEPFVNLLIGI